eukprot:scaffold2783_cov129-Cylindrotheca_fusiformis.AAC.16
MVRICFLRVFLYTARAGALILSDYQKAIHGRSVLELIQPTYLVAEFENNFCWLDLGGNNDLKLGNLGWCTEPRL